MSKLQPPVTTLNISPDWKGSTLDEVRIIRRITRHEGTGKAIMEFDRLQGGLSHYWYWYTLGTLWVNYSGFSDLARWRRLFGSGRPFRESSLMKPDELRALQVMREQSVFIRAYRAPRHGVTDFISLTISREVAERLAKSRNTCVYTYSVPIAEISAYFSRREESEILVTNKSRALLVSI